MKDDKLQEIIELLPYTIRYSGEIEELLDYAKEQAERVEELEKENKLLRFIAEENKIAYEQRAEQNKRYREALKNTQNAILQNLQKWNYKDEVKLYEAYKHNEKALEGEE